MSKVVDAIGGMISGPDEAWGAVADAAVAKYKQTEMTPEQKAAQRAALAAQGRRPGEEEAGKAGVRPLQGSGTKSSYWA